MIMRTILRSQRWSKNPPLHLCNWEQPWATKPQRQATFRSLIGSTTLLACSRSSPSEKASGSVCISLLQSNVTDVKLLNINLTVGLSTHLFTANAIWLSKPIAKSARNVPRLHSQFPFAVNQWLDRPTITGRHRLNSFFLSKNMLISVQLAKF